MSQDSHNLVQSESLSFPEQLPDDPSRRMLLGTACAIGGVATLATLVPFVASMTPSDRARAAGAPVEVDISQIAPGTMIAVEWQGKPVWILHRTPEMIESLKATEDLLADPKSERPGYTPDYAKNQYRSRKDQWFVCVGICTHLGCSPSSRLKDGNAEGMSSDWKGGYLCPCHGSHFDLAGRVFKNQPAPDNLLVPPYYFVDDTHILVGLEAAA